jgi:flagellar biosynthesis protein FlhA
MDPRLEERIQRSIEHTEGGSFLTLRPAEVQGINEAIAEALNPLLTAGHQAVLLTSPQIRAHVKRMSESAIPMLVVLSYNEILPEFTVESMGMVEMPE